MSIDIVASNNALAHLKKVVKKKELSNYVAEDITDDESEFSPAYIVELSEKGKQLQRAYPVNIVHL